jgi:hypothetical protein
MITRFAMTDGRLAAFTAFGAPAGSCRDGHRAGWRNHRTGLNGGVADSLDEAKAAFRAAQQHARE